jgi:hypothetical protein
MSPAEPQPAPTRAARLAALRISRSCLVNTQLIQDVSRTPRGDFIPVLRGGTTVTSSEGFRDKVRAHLEHMRLGGRRACAAQLVGRFRFLRYSGESSSQISVSA